MPRELRAGDLVAAFEPDASTVCFSLTANGDELLGQGAAPLEEELPPGGEGLGRRGDGEHALAHAGQGQAHVLSRGPVLSHEGGAPDVQDELGEVLGGGQDGRHAGGVPVVHVKRRFNLDPPRRLPLIAWGA